MTEHVAFEPVWIGGPDSVPESALPLAGGPLRFGGCVVARRDSAAPERVRREALSIPDLVRVDGARDALDRICAPRPAFAGLDLAAPQVMGIINVTPDSFSDGGDRLDADKAVADGLEMWAAGATILDVGGESTRPGAEPIGADAELRRVLPVVERLAAEGCRVSIDTRRARTMREAVAAGAAVVNDVTALGWDPEAMAAVAELQVPVILMHMQGTPETMQASPRYADAALDVYDYLAGRVAACEAAGIPRERIAVDPGVGFGKTVQHNLEIMNRLALYHGLGCPVLLGVSRKSTIGKLSRGEPPKERVPGSLAAAVAGAARGVQILRVHDVAETVQALAVGTAIQHGRAPADTPA